VLRPQATAPVLRQAFDAGRSLFVGNIGAGAQVRLVRAVQ